MRPNVADINNIAFIWLVARMASLISLLLEQTLNLALPSEAHIPNRAINSESQAAAPIAGIQA